MDCIKVFYVGLTELMEYVKPYYSYKYWIRLVQYTWSMWRYEVAANYIQLKDKDQNKGVAMHIYGMTKAMGNIARFINSTWHKTTNKQPNYIFEGHEGNCVFVCVIKSIDAREELLVNYNLNQIDTYVIIMGALCISFHLTSN